MINKIIAENNIKPENTVIFSDMTGTVLFQKEDGFPNENKNLIKAFANKGGIFVLVTGDSSTTVNDEFIKPIDYELDNEIFIISGSGHEISSLRNRTLTSLFKSKPISNDTLKELIKILEEEILFKISTQKLFTELEIKNFVENGDKIDITPKTNGIFPKVTFEIRENLFSLYIPYAEGENNKKRDEIFDMIENNTKIHELVKMEDCKIIIGYNYVNIITKTKDEGLETFLNYKKIIDINMKNILVLGDSINDLGLFNFEYENYKSLHKFFLGDDNLVYALIDENSSSKKIYLKDKFVRGTEEILNCLL